MKVFVTGGAGYVGSMLVPELIKKGHSVVVYDTFWFWDSESDFTCVLNLRNSNNLKLVKGDIRDYKHLFDSMIGCDAVIHLACISNDPSAELDDKFTHSINYDGSINVIDCAKELKIKRFIYASSSSVYGVKNQKNVSEDLPMEPLTQYSKLKVEIEHYLQHKFDDNFKGAVLRPSTVCGFSPRLRLDVVVNILTNLAINKKIIKVFGGEQLRPNINIKDMVNAYCLMLELPIDKINKKVYNVGYENMKVIDIANLVKKALQKNINIEICPTDDLRSYHVSSDKIKNELGFKTNYSVEEAILTLKTAFEDKIIKNVNDDKYYNVNRMKRFLQEGLK